MTLTIPTFTHQTRLDIYFVYGRQTAYLLIELY